MNKINLRDGKWQKKPNFTRQYLANTFKAGSYSEIRKFDPEYSFRKSLGKSKTGICENCKVKTTLIPSTVFITRIESKPIIYLCEKCRRDFFTRLKIENDYIKYYGSVGFKTSPELFWRRDFTLFRWMMLSGIEKGPLNIVSEIFRLRVFYINVRFLKTSLDEFKIFYGMIHRTNPIQKKIEWMIEAFDRIT